MALYLHPPYSFMVWCLVKHRDNFTFICDEKCIHGYYWLLSSTHLSNIAAASHIHMAGLCGFSYKCDELVVTKTSFH
jgi:hypothetical protein